MTKAHNINQHLQDRYGSAENVLIKDPALPTGFRIWRKEDSEQLLNFLELLDPETNINQRTIDQPVCNSHRPPQPRQPLVCYNLNQAAEAVGVGVHTIQAWISRTNHTLPHIRDARRVIIPQFMLHEWLRDEALRTIGDNAVTQQPQAGCLQQTPEASQHHQALPGATKTQPVNKQSAGVPNTQNAGATGSNRT